MTNLEAKQALSRKLNIDYSTISTNDLFSDTDLQDWINQGCLKAWDFKKWDFTEDTKTMTLVAGDITSGYIDMPTDFESSSVYLFKGNSKLFDKKTFQALNKYLDDYADGDNDGSEYYYAEYKRYIFFNPNVLSTGNTIDIYGKIRFQLLSGDSDLLPFSPDIDAQENSGNQAIVLLAYAEALASEKKKNPNQAIAEQKSAYDMLNLIWNNMDKGQLLEQPRDDKSFFKPFDVLNGFTTRRDEDLFY